jgi:hypothetical protein
LALAISTAILAKAARAVAEFGEVLLHVAQVGAAVARLDLTQHPANALDHRSGYGS